MLNKLKQTSLIQNYSKIYPYIKPYWIRALIAVLFYNSWQLALVAVVALAGALYPLTTVRRKIKSVMDKTIFSGARAMTHYNETFSGNCIVASYNLYDYQNERFKETLRSVFKPVVWISQCKVRSEIVMNVITKKH